MTKNLIQPAVRTNSQRWVLSGDCQKRQQQIASDTISLILTDPPYFLHGMDETWDHTKLQKRSKPGVVGGIPAGMAFKKNQGVRLQKFLEPIAIDWLRLIKPGGFVLCFAQPRLAHRTAIAIENAGFEIRDLFAWNYEGQAKAFTQEHFVRKLPITQREKEEIILKLGGRKTPQLKPQMESIIMGQAPKSGTFVNNWLQYQTGLVDLSNPLIEPAKFPGTVIPAKKPKNRHGHITPKPVNLLQHIIRIFTAPGMDSVVYDPFTGSGSTGVAALKEGRNFFGFELDGQMANLANKRISNFHLE